MAAHDFAEGRLTPAHLRERLLIDPWRCGEACVGNSAEREKEKGEKDSHP
jgi:hypothetical protein